MANIQNKSLATRLFSRKNEIKTPDGCYKKITPKDAKLRLESKKDIILLDVRQPEEFNQIHIPKAILLPLNSIGGSMPTALPDGSQEIIVYCQSGVRSAVATKKLLALGYTNVFDMGGINRWIYETE